MSDYRHVLFATDFSSDALQVGVKAIAIADRNKARLSMLHVIEEANISAGYELMPMVPEMPDEGAVRAAKQAMEQLAKKLGLENIDKQVVTAKSTKEGILGSATKHKVDLIVVGSHGRHGLALLLGSTANAVLHGATCDVLAVRIKKQ